jgi:sigma-B regulation protein RsbU (phosphoserine phosphatase)
LLATHSTETRVNLLIVDDDPATKTLMQDWLQSSGHAVTCLDSEHVTASTFSDTNYDIVLCNWNLTSMSGADLCHLVRRDPSYHYVIVYSSDGRELNFVECTAAGADDILSPPLNSPQLQVRILAAERTINLQQAFAEQNAAHKALNEKLDLAYQTLYAELQAASELQLSLLPTISEIHPNYALDWLVLPSSFLAGDNLNYFIMQERYLIFYHLDVAGHGIPSALLSVTLNQLLSPQPGSPMVRFDPQLELKRIVPPVEVVSELNRRFQPQGDGYFTMIYAVLDTETHEIRLCQAGHPSPIKIAADGEISEIGDGGFPVGLWPDMTYEETRTNLMPGDRLVLYSDGVIACLNDQQVPYSLEQMKAIIGSQSGKPLKDVLQAVQADLEQWNQGKDFPDDISLLIVECKA